MKKFKYTAVFIENNKYSKTQFDYYASSWQRAKDVLVEKFPSYKKCQSKLGYNIIYLYLHNEDGKGGEKIC